MSARIGYLLIDTSNLLFAAVSAPTLKVGDQETQGVFHFVRRIREIVATYPMLMPIALWDGLSWRKEAFAEYKGSRDAAPTTKHEKVVSAQRLSFRSQRPFVRKSLEHLGIVQMMATNLEADDLAGILVRRYAPMSRKIILISGDKDWLQLVQPGVIWLDLVNKRRCSMKNFEAFTGVKTARQFLEYKALVGDTSDEIGGVGGIGEKGAIELLNTYGSVGAFLNQVVDKTIDVSTLPKKFRDLAEMGEKSAIYERNLGLMDLNHPLIPAPKGFDLKKGALNEAEFGEICRKLMFTSIIEKKDQWLAPFRAIAA